MANFFTELRRRKVFRVAAGYAVVIWLIMQVVSVLNDPLNLPDWFDTVVILLLAIGFPIALIFTWAFELTPEGLKRSRDVAASTSDTGSKLDYGLIIVLAFMGVVTVWDRLPATTNSTPNTIRTSGQEVTEQSVAVLPFIDLSPDGDQAYFADGIADELRYELARLNGLRVAGRTSSLSFRESSDDLVTIGKTLNVTTILEGSVSKDGQSIRVIAQLINVDNGYQLWSQTYQRELTDVFAIQEEIARSVTGALGVTLDVGERNQFRGAGTRNITAYDAFLEGMSSDSTDQAIGHFRRATQLDPEYAPAWAMLGNSIGSNGWNAAEPAQVAAVIEETYQNTLRGLELDPDSARVNSIMGAQGWVRAEWIEGEQAHQKALSLRRDSDFIGRYGNFLLRAGRISSAEIQYESQQELDPLALQGLRPNVAYAQGRYDDVEAVVQTYEARGTPESVITEMRLQIGLNSGAEDIIKTQLSLLASSRTPTAALYAAILENFDSPASVLSMLSSADADQSKLWPNKPIDIAFLAAYFGDPELALSIMSDELRQSRRRLVYLWHPVLSEARELPAFKQLVTDLNLVEYWREYGWADVCRPIGEDDFACQ